MATIVMLTETRFFECRASLVVLENQLQRLLLHHNAVSSDTQRKYVAVQVYFVLWLHENESCLSLSNIENQMFGPAVCVSCPSIVCRLVFRNTVVFFEAIKKNSHCACQMSWCRIQTISEFRERSFAFFSGVNKSCGSPPILTSFEDYDDSINPVFCALLQSGLVPIHGAFQRFDHNWTQNMRVVASRAKFRHKAFLHFILAPENLKQAHYLSERCKQLGYTVSSIVPCQSDPFPCDVFVRQVCYDGDEGWRSILSDDIRALYGKFRIAPNCVSQFPTSWCGYRNILDGNHHFAIVDSAWPESDEGKPNLFEDLGRIVGLDKIIISSHAAHGSKKWC
jgi:hypothetical protein